MKYEFTGETKVFHGVTLQRIRALRDMPGLKAGDLGGWIESKKNLSQTGNAWVYGNARVYGDALVSGDALVQKPLTTATRSDGYTFALLPVSDGGFRITAGCRFFTFPEAWKHWTKTRSGTPLGEETFAILRFFEAVISAHAPTRPRRRPHESH